MLRLFDFKCSRCGKEFEQFVDVQKDEEPATTCVYCTGVSFRVPSVSSFKFGFKKDSGKNRWI